MPSTIEKWPAWLTAVTQAFGVNGETGVDLATPLGTPIPALWGGTVVQAGNTLWGDGTTSGGLVLIKANVANLGQQMTYYLHLDKLAPGIVPGATVSPGTIIGYSGGQNTGGQWVTSPSRSTGPHTEIGINASFARPIGPNINPLPYIQAVVSGSMPTGGTPTGATTTGATTTGATDATVPWYDVQGQINAALAPLIGGTEQYIAVGIEIFVVTMIALVLIYFAVVLLTGEDIGTPISEGVKGGLALV